VKENSGSWRKGPPRTSRPPALQGPHGRLLRYRNKQVNFQPHRTCRAISASAEFSSVSDTRMLRLLPPAYGDGVYAPSGADRPNPHDIANAVFTGQSGHGSYNGRTALLVFFGETSYLAICIKVQTGVQIGLLVSLLLIFESSIFSCVVRNFSHFEISVESLFGKKISNVSSPLSKQITFKILFRNVEQVQIYL